MSPIHPHRLQDVENVRNEIGPPVRLYDGWPGRLAKAPDLRGNHPKACLNQGGNLITPEKARVRKAMQEQDRRAASNIDYRKVFTLDINNLGDCIKVHRLYSFTLSSIRHAQDKFRPVGEKSLIQNINPEGNGRKSYPVRLRSGPPLRHNLK